jgi:hypothetical protein
MITDDWDDEDWDDLEEDDIVDLDDLLLQVDDYYADDEEDLDEGEGEFILPYDWTVDYLTTRHNEGIDIEELDERWNDLCDYMFYLDERDDAPSTLADIQGHHLSEFIIEFWDEEIEDETPLAFKRHAIETIRDLYTYLAAQEHISKDADHRVTKAAAALFKRKNKLTPIRK